MLALCWSLFLGTSAAAWLTILLDKPDTAVRKTAPYLSSIHWPKWSQLVWVYAANGGVISWHWQSTSTRSLLSGKGFTSGEFACWLCDPPRSSAPWIGSDVLDPLVSWSSTLNGRKRPLSLFDFFLRKVKLPSGEREMFAWPILYNVSLVFRQSVYMWFLLNIFFFPSEKRLLVRLCSCSRCFHVSISRQCSIS